MGILSSDEGSLNSGVVGIVSNGAGETWSGGGLLVIFWKTRMIHRDVESEIVNGIAIEIDFLSCMKGTLLYVMSICHYRHGRYDHHHRTWMMVQSDLANGNCRAYLEMQSDHCAEVEGYGLWNFLRLVTYLC